MEESVGEKYARECRQHLVEKYRLPKDATWKQIEAAIDGYAAGRAGRPIPQNASNEFQTGWAKGDSAADASSNSCQSWGY